MNKIFMFLKVLLIPLTALFILPLFISLFNAFGLALNKIVLIIISSLLMIVSGFIIGKKSNKKGFVSGGILGIAFIIVLIIFGLFFKLNFNLARIVYYLILLLSSILGAIIGINKKKSN